MARKRVVLAALIKRIEVKVDQLDIHLRRLRLCALFDLPATPSQGVNDDEIELLSVPVRLRRSGREIRMVINGTDSFAAKPDARLIKGLAGFRGSRSYHRPLGWRRSSPSVSELRVVHGRSRRPASPAGAVLEASCCHGGAPLDRAG